MLLVAHQAMRSAPTPEGNNLALEAFLVHARNFLAFFATSGYRERPGEGFCFSDASHCHARSSFKSKTAPPKAGAPELQPPTSRNPTPQTLAWGYDIHKGARTPPLLQSARSRILRRRCFSRQSIPSPRFNRLRWRVAWARPPSPLPQPMRPSLLAS